MYLHSLPLCSNGTNTTSKLVVRRANTDPPTCHLLLRCTPGRGQGSDFRGKSYNILPLCGSGGAEAAYLNLQHHVRRTAPSQATTEAPSVRALSDALQAKRRILTPFFIPPCCIFDAGCIFYHLLMSQLPQAE